jgi:hypothetical protein
MAKKKAARKKTTKRSKSVKPGRLKAVKRRPPASKPKPKPSKPKSSKQPKPTTQETEYGPTFFLTAENETAEAYEIDGTPHHQTVYSYRLEHAAIMEFEEQDGKILYKVRPVKSPAG